MSHRVFLCFGVRREAMAAKPVCALRARQRSLALDQMDLRHTVRSRIMLSGQGRGPLPSRQP